MSKRKYDFLKARKSDEIPLPRDRALVNYGEILSQFIESGSEAMEISQADVQKYNIKILSLKNRARKDYPNEIIVYSKDGNIYMRKLEIAEETTGRFGR